MARTSLFVSASKLSLVAVKRGGAWGGTLYFAGAMVELVSGRNIVWLPETGRGLM